MPRVVIVPSRWGRFDAIPVDIADAVDHLDADRSVAALPEVRPDRGSGLRGVRHVQQVASGHPRSGLLQQGHRDERVHLQNQSQTRTSQSGRRTGDGR